MKFIFSVLFIGIGITQAQNIGVGTTNPTTKVEVVEEENTALQATNTSGSRPAAVLKSTGTGKLALEIDGFLKVSGTKTAFVHTTSAANISSNVSFLTYDSPKQTDIIILTHNWTPTGVYFNKFVGVYWTGTRWGIFTEDISTMPPNVVFNVLVIRQ